MDRFKPFPNLETSRLLLRKMEYSDAQDLFEMRNDSAMNIHTDTIPDSSINDTLKYIMKMNEGVEQGKWIIWCLEHKEDKKVIGTVSIWNFKHDCGELGYGTTTAYQGMGYMKEALRAVLKHGFSVLELSVIQAYTEKSNSQSTKLLESHGFEASGSIIEEGIRKDVIFDMLIYELRKAKWKNE